MDTEIYCLRCESDPCKCDTGLSATATVDEKMLCPENCGGIVEQVGGGIYCERCGYKEEL